MEVNEIKTEKKLSILPPELTGTVLVTGELGIGKTTFALTADLPQNIVMVDLDEKGEGIANQLGLGAYFAPTRISSEPYRIYELFENWLDGLPENEYTTAVIDNISLLEDGMRQVVKAKPKYYAEKYGLKEKNIKSGSFGGANPAANHMISEMIAKFREKGIRLVIQIAHTGNKWVPGGIVPGKRTIKGLGRWDNLSILSLVLIPPRGDEPQTGAPAALVRKEQLASYAIQVTTPEEAQAMMNGKSGHTIRRRLPRRIYPCTWEQVRWYLQNPTDFENSKPHEIPLDEEIQPYEERLRDDQISYITATMEFAAAEMKAEQSMSKEELEAHNKFISDMAEVVSANNIQLSPVEIKAGLNKLDHKCEIIDAVKIMNYIKENE